MNKKNALMHFGEHLTIDGYEGDRALLDDMDLIKNLLKNLPQMLNMSILSPPLVISAPDNEIQDPGGWSGFVIIAESHISLHTFPRRGFLSADVYTCKPSLDKQLIIHYFTKTFSLKEVESHLVRRGTKYPQINIF